MNWVMDLCGAEPIIRDVPVYDAASMAKGELLMLGTTADDSGADQGVAFITAYAGSSSDAVDALGICMEDFATAADIDNTPVQGSKYLKAIINPFAVYRAEYSQGTSDDVAITTGGTSTTITVSSLENNWDAGWMYFPLASGGAAGMLRFVVAAAAGSCTVNSAITTTTSDTLIKIRPQNSRLTNLNTAATMLTSAAGAPDGVSLHVIRNMITSDAHPLKELTYADFNGATTALSGARIFADIAMLDHVYNNA